VQDSIQTTSLTIDVYPRNQKEQIVIILKKKNTIKDIQGYRANFKSDESGIIF